MPEDLAGLIANAWVVATAVTAWLSLLESECAIIWGEYDLRKAFACDTPCDWTASGPAVTPPVLQAGPFQALQQRDGERAGRPGPRGLPGAQHRRADTGQESPVRLFLPKALVRAGVRQPVHRVPPHRPHTGTVGLQRGKCAMMRKKLITRVVLHRRRWCSFKLYSVF